MAEDGSQDKTMAEEKPQPKPRRRRPRPQKAEKAQQPVAEASAPKPAVEPVSLEGVAPKDLPPYVDPHGREIRWGHKQRALRKANELGLKPENENHALYLVAERGIDVIGMSDSILDIAKRAKKNEKENLPVMQDPNKMNALAQVVPETEERQDREATIAEIQLGLVRRRRKRIMALMLRLAVFVFLPTFIVGYYYANVATEMFETESAFVIQTSENPAAASGLGGLLAGTGFATSQDSIVVQDYLNSREAFLRLERDFNYTEHFQDPKIDVIQRLSSDATIDDAYAYFTNRVTIGYDPTEGVIRMTVVGASPEMSQQFSEALVGYAEERVDGLSQEARGDQLEVAVANYNEAEDSMLNAQQRVLALQQQRGVLSAEVELSSQMTIIGTLELQRENKRLELAQTLANPTPNPGTVRVLERDIANLDNRIAELRQDLTQTSDSTVSLARIGAELRIAESELATRTLILQEAIGSLEAARLEANRQVRYLSLGVSPVAPVEATFPKKIEGTALAFLIFSGIYILCSLTVSILREQVTV